MALKTKTMVRSHDHYQEAHRRTDSGIAFFILEIVIAVVLGYVVLRLHGLKYDFHLVLHEGIRFGLYLGGVITILAFIGTPRRRPPF